MKDIYELLNDLDIDENEFQEMEVSEFEKERVKKQLKQSLNKKKTKGWKRVLVPTAACLVALGLTVNFNPSLAKWVGGFFTTEQVDEGLRSASELGLTERIDRAVTDQNITFKVEDIIADTSRVALSYQVVKDGKIIHPRLDFRDEINVVTAYDQDGNRIEAFGTGWFSGSDYGFVEISLREHGAIESMTIHFDLAEIDGAKGNWSLDIPIDLKDLQHMTTTFVLNDEKTSEHGVGVHVKEVRFAPTSNEIIYDTYFTTEEKKNMEAQIEKLENTIDVKGLTMPLYKDTAIQYHIENSRGETLYRYNAFQQQGQVEHLNFMQSTAIDGEELGHMHWNDSFIPQKDDEQLTFVLDGVIKTVPADFSIAIDPKEIKNNPVSFEYEGNFVTINNIKMKKDYSFKKEFPPVETEQVLVIEMEGGKEAISANLGWWAIVDEKGNTYEAFGSGSILDEKDKNGRFKTKTTLTIYGMKEMPKELTLHLLTVTRYEKVESGWKVPLYK